MAESLEQTANTILDPERVPEWLPKREESYLIFGFTGQGQQRPDMFEQWYGYSQDTDSALKYFHELTETQYGKPLDSEKLESGSLMQPANVTLGVIGSMALEAASIRPNETFGHSLGELSAVYSAGCISADETIWLARKRGEATDLNIKDLEDRGISTGMMAVVLKKSDEVKEGIEDLGEKLSNIFHENDIPEKELWISNSNSPEQMVISGESEHFGKIKDGLRGIAGAVRLRVNGPFHHWSLMALAKKEYKPYVDKVAIRVPSSPALYSPTAFTVGKQQKLIKLKTREDVAKMLVEQLTSQVLYSDLIGERLAYMNRSHVSRLLGANGVHEVVFVEIGSAPPDKPTDHGVLIDLNYTNVKAYHEGEMPIRSHRVSVPDDVYSQRLTKTD